MVVYPRVRPAARRRGQDWDLVCEGLDTLATVWVNGQEIGRAANMLIGHRFAVTAALRPGRNRITVRFGSALNHAQVQP